MLNRKLTPDGILEIQSCQSGKDIFKVFVFANLIGHTVRACATDCGAWNDPVATWVTVHPLPILIPPVSP
jgi:hypothetical protein